MHRVLYHLVNDDGRVVYVGAAINPIKRLYRHVRTCERCRTPLAGYLFYESMEVRVPRVRPVASILPGADWRQIERDEIVRVWLSGEPLLNVQGIRRSRWMVDKHDRKVSAIRQAIKVGAMDIVRDLITAPETKRRKR